MPISIPRDVERCLKSMLPELDKRAKRNATLRKYLDGRSPLPTAIIRAKVTQAYRNLMPVAEAPWASLIVDSTQDRLEISGIDSGDKDVDNIVWGIWQDNALDAESKLAHSSALAEGRAFALIWPGDEGPEVSLDDSSTMIVQYAEGSRRHRTAALRCWRDEDDKTHLTLYRKDGIYKFSETREAQPGRGRVKAGDRWWEAREVDGEDWPLDNPFKVVPVVEVAINRRLKPGVFPFARGEFGHCIGLIDRINLLTFLGLVVAFSMGFPLRGVIGERVIRDDDGEPIPPFDAHASGLATMENPDAKTFEFKAADRKNLSIFAELDQLSTITKTPRHYFPIEGGFSNISADAIRASEGALHAKVTGYKATMGEGWEEVLRLCGQMSEEEVELSPRAELKWKDHESRSMAERADAAVKVAGIEGIPWAMVAEKFLNLSQEEIAKAEAQASSGVLGKLLKAAGEPEMKPEPEMPPAGHPPPHPMGG